MLSHDRSACVERLDGLLVAIVPRIGSNQGTRGCFPILRESIWLRKENVKLGQRVGRVRPISELYALEKHPIRRHLRFVADTDLSWSLLSLVEDASLSLADASRRAREELGDEETKAWLDLVSFEGYLA